MYADRAVAFQLVRANAPRHVGQPLEDLTAELLGRLLVAPPLYGDVQDMVVLIHRAPQVMALTMTGRTPFIQVPLIPGRRPPSIGVGGRERIVLMWVAHEHDHVQDRIM
jgi:hypothetical protein